MLEKRYGLDRDFGPLIVGMDPTDIEAIWDKAYVRGGHKEFGSRGIGVRYAASRKPAAVFMNEAQLGWDDGNEIRDVLWPLQEEARFNGETAIGAR